MGWLLGAALDLRVMALSGPDTPRRWVLGGSSYARASTGGVLAHLPIVGVREPFPWVSFGQCCDW